MLCDAVGSIIDTHSITRHIQLLFMLYGYGIYAVFLGIFPKRKKEEAAIKYDVLIPFKEYLMKNMKSPNTARKYYSAVVKLFDEVQFNSLEQISSDWILQEAKNKFKTRNEFSAAKNGMKWLAKLHPELSIPSEEQFRGISQKKKNFSRKPKKVIYLNPTQRKINQIRNKRLKYAYRLAAISGLRVSELEDLEAKDVTFNDGKIFVQVQKGKGGHGGCVECLEDKYLYERLPGFLQDYPEGKLFYSEAYMREYAAKLGIECHDLRRIFAIQTRNELKKEMSMEEANQVIQQRLRHARFSTTKRYLFNRKLKFEYERDGNTKAEEEENAEQQ